MLPPEEYSPFRLLKHFFPRFHYVTYLYELKKAIGQSKSTLDVGCGSDSPLGHLNIQNLVGIDGYENSVNAAKKRSVYKEVHFLDVRKLLDNFSQNAFECVVALDVIEHCSKKDGTQLIKTIEKLASKKVIFFTPNGFLPQKNIKPGDLQKHLSGWDVQEMKELGYEVFGIYGHRIFRGGFHNLRFRPKIFWGIVSEISHYLYTRSHPEKAAAILCIKNLAS